MQEHQKNTAKRIVYASVLIIAAAFLIFAHHEIHRGVNYSFEEPKVNCLADGGAGVSSPIASLDEPADVSHVIHLTLGGNCTPAAILGTNSFGTFNLMAEEEGKEGFFAQLNEVFSEDDCTILGCSAVLSDGEFPDGGHSSEELPYLGPAANAEVFSAAYAEVLSLENARCKVYGESGVSDTRAALEDAGLRFVDAENAFSFEQYGITVGILGAQLTTDADSTALIERVSSAKETSDYLILYAERYAAEDERYIDLARAAIDAGCDLVCYTGYSDGDMPSVQVYNNGMIVDSLGYLLDGSTFTPSDTALYCVSISVNGDTVEQVEGTLVPVTYSENPWIPVLKK